MAKLARGKTNAASGQRTVSEHNRARNQKARGTHDARRNLLHRDADAEISRAPEDIDQPEGNNDLPRARGRVHFHSMRLEIRKNSEYQNAAKAPLATPPTTSPSRRGFCRRLPRRSERSRGHRCRYNRSPRAPDRGVSGGAIRSAASVPSGRRNTAPWRTSICTRAQTAVRH